VTELASSGAAASGSPFTAGGLKAPVAVAVDSGGSAWVADNANASVTRVSQTGSILSGTNGYTAGGLAFPYGIAIDGSGSGWVVSQNPFSVTALSTSDALLSGPSGYLNSGLNLPASVAIDGSGDAWVANNGNNTVSELIGAATPVVTPIAAGLPATASANGSSRLGTQP